VIRPNLREHACPSTRGDGIDVGRELAVENVDVGEVMTAERAPASNAGALRFGAIEPLDGAFRRQPDDAERQPIERRVVEVIEAERFHSSRSLPRDGFVVYRTLCGASARVLDWS
jgi:hypothetical protein